VLVCYLELELHICLPDLTHVTLTIDQRTQATEIMDSVIEMLELNAREARHVLSLWLVSSDLGRTYFGFYKIFYSRYFLRFGVPFNLWLNL